MRVYTKVTSYWNDVLGCYVADFANSEWYDTQGQVALCCGASSQQNQISQAQQSYYSTLTQQAGQVFGMASGIFNDLKSAFQPILDKGINQEGFSAAETQNLNNEVTNDVGAAYKKAADATNSELAAQGGGDVPIISSQQNQVRKDLAQSAASQEGSERQQIISNDYAQGRQNFAAAAGALSGATNVFGASTGAAGAANQGGSDAASTANQISEQNNSWVNATIGALGSVAGATMTGGMTNLGAGHGFFGGNA